MQVGGWMFEDYGDIKLSPLAFSLKGFTVRTSAIRMKGDTIEINNPFCAIPIAAIVSDIDSVSIEPGNEQRKRISLYEYQYYFNEEYWIEGIGSFIVGRRRFRIVWLTRCLLCQTHTRNFG